MPDFEERLAGIVVDTVKAAQAPLAARQAALDAYLQKANESVETATRVALELRERVALLEQRAPVPGPAGSQGERGLQGERGEQGLQGPAGAQGERGICGLQGLQGDAGERGLTGERGEMGPPGPEGRPGADGAAGPEGKAGQAGEPGVAGPAGPAGLAGEAGPAGQAGPTGPVGPVGPVGPAGEVGPAGQKGDAGERGLQGERGADGVITNDVIHALEQRCVATFQERFQRALDALAAAVAGVNETVTSLSRSVLTAEQRAIDDSIDDVDAAAEAFAERLRKECGALVSPKPAPQTKTVKTVERAGDGKFIVTQEIVAQ